MKKAKQIAAELDQIAADNNGVLRGEDVVAFAEDNPTSAIHSRLEWDNEKASHEFRLIQARRLIKIHLVIVEPDTETVPVWVSMEADRRKPGGGYKNINFVMSNSDEREKLVAQALREAARWREKYANLEELASVFRALDKISSRVV